MDTVKANIDAFIEGFAAYLYFEKNNIALASSARDWNGA